MAAKISVLLSFTLCILYFVLCVLGLSSSTKKIAPSSLSLSLSFHLDSFCMSLQSTLYSQGKPNITTDSLMIEILRHDAARVKSIDNLMSIYEMRQVYNIPVYSGYAVYNGGTFQYVTSVGVGQPSQFFNLILDTGSALSWVNSDLCNKCGNEFFSRNMSSTYKEISCHMEQCQYARNSRCYYQACYYSLSYGDGTTVSGILSSENLSFRNSDSFNGLLIGATRESDDQGQIPGLLGLGRGKLSLVSQLNASSFSYCLVDHSSRASSTLDFNTSILPRSDTTPLLPHDLFYQVTLTLISVNRQQIPIIPAIFDGKIIIDSGTIVTRLPTRTYNLFRDAFIQNSQGFSNRISYGSFDTCYEFWDMDSDAIFPIVWLYFGGTILRLGEANLFLEFPLRGVHCLAFLPTKSTPILGNTQQLNTRVTFDLANSLVGFSPNYC